MSAMEIIKPKSWPFFDHERYTFSLAVKKRNLLFVSGCCASQYDSSLKKIVCRGGIVEQLGVIYEKMKLILEAAGASFDDVVKTVDYVTPEGLKDYRETGRVRREYFTGTFPVATGIVVNRLLRPDALLEVDCIAVLGDEKKEMITSGHPRYEKLTYREGVRKGNILFISGTTAADPVTRETVGVGDVGAQTRKIYEKFETVLEAAGGSFDDVVKTVDYVTPEGLKDYRETGRVRREYFTGTFPVATGIVVNRLLRPDAMIEIDCIVVLGDEKKEMITSGHPRYEKLTYREGVKKGNILFISGTTAADPVTRETVGVGDVGAQTRKIYEKFETVLAAAGGSFDDVVKTVDYVTPEGLKDYRETAGIRREYFTGSSPAAMGFVANKLLRPDAMIEIDCIAVLD